jgi:hypothetical protein
MKHLPLAWALIAAPIALGGCSTLSVAVSSPADEKALYVAESAFAGAVLSVEAAVDAGRLKGSDATKAAAYLKQARSALLKARAAYAISDAAQSKSQADLTVALLANIGTLIK